MSTATPIQKCLLSQRQRGFQVLPSTYAYIAEEHPETVREARKRALKMTVVMIVVLSSEKSTTQLELP